MNVDYERIMRSWRSCLLFNFSMAFFVFVFSAIELTMTSRFSVFCFVVISLSIVVSRNTDLCHLHQEPTKTTRNLVYIP
jgi:hypothetical protein